MQLRMTRAICEELRGDLSRPHPFAYERVGYVFIRPAGERVLVTTGYESVPDEFYIEDKTVGARIDHRGIALAMKRADQNKKGILHVHVHGGYGFSGFSRGDVADHPNFLRSFRNANPKMPHGFLLLSIDMMMARVWPPGDEFYSDIFRYTIVGLPFSFHWTGGGRGCARRTTANHFSVRI